MNNKTKLPIKKLFLKNTNTIMIYIKCNVYNIIQFYKMFTFTNVRMFIYSRCCSASLLNWSK